MTNPTTITCILPRRRPRSPVAVTTSQVGQAASQTLPSQGCVPRIARLMALALRLEHLVQSGAVADYAALAALGHMSRARVTQILNLRLLAPDIQEALLFWPATPTGRDSIQLRQLQPLAALLDWRQQRSRWQELCCGAAKGRNEDKRISTVANVEPAG
jgi:hypothetical protein